MRLILALAPLIAGCASSQPPAIAPSGPAATQIASTETTAKIESTSDQDKGVHVPAGYHVVDRDGVKFYCTDTPALGTRIKSRNTCMTADQFQRAQEEAQDRMREKQGQRWGRE